MLSQCFSVKGEKGPQSGKDVFAGSAADLFFPLLRIVSILGCTFASAPGCHIDGLNSAEYRGNATSNACQSLRQIAGTSPAMTNGNWNTRPRHIGVCRAPLENGERDAIIASPAANFPCPAFSLFYSRPQFGQHHRMPQTTASDSAACHFPACVSISRNCSAISDGRSGISSRQICATRS